MKQSRGTVPALVSLFFLSLVSAAFLWAAPVAAEQAPAVAEESRDFRQIVFSPLAAYDALTLTLSGPGGMTWTRNFAPGRMPVIRVADGQTPLEDGHYWYELAAGRSRGAKTRSDLEDGRADGDAATGENIPLPHPEPLCGHFLVEGGQIVSGDHVEKDSATRTPPVMDGDVVHNDDLIVTGSFCVGFDCVVDEAFGFDTIRLKENNLRIKFDDTSVSPFPANDWQITANDSASGGANKFSIDDITNAKTPFTILANAPSNSIFVDSSGRLGLKTATPVLDVHVKKGDSPGLRLEQDSSSGWTAQTWDVVGNESNFFVRDVTGGSRLPFRIQPAAPTNSIYIAADGDVGMNTSAPGYALHVSRTGTNAGFVLERTDGVKAYVNATNAFGNFGTVSNHPLRIVSNSVWRMTVNTDNSLTMANGASLTAGGIWTNASSRQLKENILGLTAEEAFLALAGLEPVTFHYRDDPMENHVGFVAEDVPELVATNDRTGLSPMDIVAVLTKVVQEQQKAIQELTRRVQDLEGR